MEGVAGGLRRPAECDGLISEEVWASLSEERRRMLIGVLHRTEADNVKTPLGVPDESHFAPAPPGSSIKAMMPSNGYCELVRRQKEGDARHERNERARQEREEVAQREREERVRQHREERAHKKSKTLTPATGDNQGKMVTEEMDPSNAHGSSHLLSRAVHDSRDLMFIRNHRIHDLSETKLGPMRYTLCELGDICHHYPSSMLQIHDILVNFHMGGPYCKVMPNDILGSPIEVYGFFATRDVQDYSRNYIFRRTRENAQALNVAGGYLRLKNPARGISATGCLIEIDIRIKAKHVELDSIIIDGSVAAICEFDPWRMNHIDGFDGRVTFESSVVNRGVEATIQLDFLEVPQGGFHVRMRGNTAVSKHFHYFIDECRRDCDGFIASPGKYEEKFIAAVSKGDTLYIEFMEGRDALSFVATKHGNEQQFYRFSNGAVVSVQVYWSTISVVNGNVAE